MQESLFVVINNNTINSLYKKLPFSEWLGHFQFFD
jgi:hypothetical protein